MPGIGQGDFLHGDESIPIRYHIHVSAKLRIRILVTRQNNRPPCHRSEIVARTVAPLRCRYLPRPPVEGNLDSVAFSPEPIYIEIATGLDVCNVFAADAYPRPLTPPRNAQPHCETRLALRRNVQFPDIAVRKARRRRQPYVFHADAHCRIECLVEIHHRSTIPLHDGVIRYIRKADGAVQVAAGDTARREIPAPSLVGGLPPVQKIYIAEPIAFRRHGAEQSVVDVPLHRVSRTDIARERENPAAELQPRHPDASLHHPLHCRIRLLERRTIPRLAHDLWMMWLVAAAVAYDSQFVCQDVGKKIQAGATNSLIPC